MSVLAFLLIFASAGLHASWNMIAKKERMTIAFYAVLCTVGAVWTSFMHFLSPLCFFSMPPRFYLALAGTLCGEIFYGLGIVRAYRTLDMSSAYPMMRSLPLLIIAFVTTLCGFGRPLTPHAQIGMALVFAGCLFMPLKRFSELKLRNYLNRGMLYILSVAVGTTLYTIFDSRAQAVMRESFPDVSKPVISLTYYSFRAPTVATLFWVLTFSVRPWRDEAISLWRKRSYLPIAAGVCSSLTYVLVLTAMNFVTNVSYVQAFRQIGLLIGMLEGIFILKETCTMPKVAGITLILSGLALSVL